MKFYSDYEASFKIDIFFSGVAKPNNYANFSAENEKTSFEEAEIDLAASFEKENATK